MRVVHLLVGGSAGLVLAGILGLGCSSSSSSPATNTAKDAAMSDVTTTDVATLEDASGDAEACDLDAALVFDLPDASIGDGGASTGQCLACAQQQCTDAFAQCAASCGCRADITSVQACILAGGSFTNCGINAFTNGDQTAIPIGEGIVSCVQMSTCATTCGVASKTTSDSGTDASGTDASDASIDATND